MENKLEIGGQTIFGMESGGNSTDGYWIKYADGRLICYGKTPPMNSGTLTLYSGMYYGVIECEYNFPMAFISVPIVSTTIHSDNLTVCDGLYVLSTKIRHIGILTPQSSVDNVYVDYIAIGRWK